MEWDDNSIDDPQAEPYRDPRDSRARGTPQRMWAEDTVREYEHFARFGMPDREIARRLGITLDSLSSCRRVVRQRKEREANVGNL